MQQNRRETIWQFLCVKKKYFETSREVVCEILVHYCIHIFIITLPVMPTTEGFNAIGVRNCIDSPNAFAVCSLISGAPLSIPSRNIPRKGVKP